MLPGTNTGGVSSRSSAGPVPRLLVRHGLMFDAPAPLSALDLGFHDGLAARPAGPLVDGRPYSDLVARTRPGLFDGPILRLVDAYRDGPGLRLRFTRDNYFAFLDTSEVLAHEAAAMVEAGRRRFDGPYRPPLRLAV